MKKFKRIKISGGLLIAILTKNKEIRFKLYIKYILSRANADFYPVDYNKKKIIVALAADYGNLGDVAITFAQTKFLEKNFPNHEIIEFPISGTFTNMKSLKKICNKNDVITIVGGGNTGDMYDYIEYCRQFIIKKFPLNQIISFPQTIDFSNSVTGRKALKQSQKIYSNHKRLILSAREEESLKKYKEFFPQNKILFLPDIVLSLQQEMSSFKRAGITLCLRNDKEKNIDISQQNILIKFLEEKYEIRYYDTHISRDNLSTQERDDELKKIWTAFKKSKIVVTDRLHGMIFCVITKTPCIAIDNSNHKVSGVYKVWLKNLNYIRMTEANNVKEITSAIDDLWELSDEKIIGYESDNNFDILKNLIK